MNIVAIVLIEKNMEAIVNGHGIIQSIQILITSPPVWNMNSQP